MTSVRGDFSADSRAIAPCTCTITVHTCNATELLHQDLLAHAEYFPFKFHQSHFEAIHESLFGTNRQRSSMILSLADGT